MRIRIPGRTTTAGGDVRASEAAMPCGSAPLLLADGGASGDVCEVGVCAPVAGVPAFAAGSLTMVDCEEDREKVFASGVRCVSLSSVP